MRLEQAIAFDAEGERWITLSNGKRCKIDGDGDVIAGFKGFMGKNISEIGPTETEMNLYSKPAKSYGEYLKDAQEAGDKNSHAKAAKQFYRENLQNTYLTTTIGNYGEQDVLFTGKSGGKLLHDVGGNPLKAALIEDIPSVIQAKNYVDSGPPKDKDRKDKDRKDFDKFHYFRTTVIKNVDGKDRRVRVQVDVGQRRDSYEVNEVYHLSHDEKTKPAGSSIAGANYLPPLPSELDENNIPQIFEFVNLEVLEEKEDMIADTLTFDATTLRRKDENGFLHVAVSHISKETVNSYRGREIPGWPDLGLDPNQIYQGYRCQVK